MDWTWVQGLGYSGLVQGVRYRSGVLECGAGEGCRSGVQEWGPGVGCRSGVQEWGLRVGSMVQERGPRMGSTVERGETALEQVDFLVFPHSTCLRV